MSKSKKIDNTKQQPERQSTTISLPSNLQTLEKHFLFRNQFHSIFRFEVFQLNDAMKIDTSITKRIFIKTYHQQGAQLNNPDENFDFFFGEKKTTFIKQVMHTLKMI